MMIRKIVFAAAAMVMSAGAAQAQNIVVNPSLETGGAGWYSNGSFFNNADYAHTNTGAWGTGCVGHGCVSTYNSGAYFGQALVTSPGATYDLSLWIAENAGPTSEFSVFWGGVLVADVLNPSNYSGTGTVHDNYRQLFVNGLTATGATTDLQIHGRQDPAGIYFDDISVTASDTGAVPEPATWAMMIGGFGLAGAALRRRRIANAKLASA